MERYSSLFIIFLKSFSIFLWCDLITSRSRNIFTQTLKSNTIAHDTFTRAHPHQTTV